MRWLVKRVLQAFATLVAVVTLTFGIIRFLPGGPLDFIQAQLQSQLGASASRERMNALARQYVAVDPDKPLHEQYVEYVASLLQGDLGTSMYLREPVADIIGAALPWTLFVMGISLALSFLIGTGLGALMAYREGSRFDFNLTSLSLLLNSIPYYVVALVLLYALGFQSGIFPTHGRVGEVSNPYSVEYILSALHHAALPIASVVLSGFGGWALTMRGNSIQVLGEDYLRAARIRGLSTRRLTLQYVGKNAILPMYTSLMISIGFLFGGSIILESIFAYPGVGYYMLQGVNSRDYPLMMGIFLIITIAVIVGIFIADLTYGLIDPRIRVGDEE